MEALDGNAIGGLLHDVFGAEMTAAQGTCAACGARGPVRRPWCTWTRPAPWSAAATAPACSW